MSLAQQSMQTGSSGAPVKNALEGLTRLGQGALGGYMAGKVGSEYEDKAKQIADERQRAMAALLKGDYAGVSALSPDNADIGNLAMTAQMQERQNQALLNRQIAADKAKREADPLNQLLQQALVGQGDQMQPQQPIQAPQTMSPPAGIPISGNAPPLQSMQMPQASQGMPQQPSKITDQEKLVSAALSKRLGSPTEGEIWTLSGGKIGTKPIEGFQRKLSPTEQKELFETMDLVLSGEQAKTSLEDAYSAMNEKKPYTGATADLLVQANRLPVVGEFINDERAIATSTIKNAVTEQALNQLKSIFGGMPTEGERKILLDLQALPTFEKGEQQAILERARKAVDRRLEFNKQKARGIQTGGYKTMPIGEPSTSGITFLGFE